MKKLVMILLGLSLVASHVTAATQTNILFIFADDWGWGDLRCHGHPYVKTPKIDRLAREGTDFHRFTVASGVCSPSRTAVMTGHFPARYNIDGHFAWVPSNAKRNMPDWLSPKAPLLPRFLRQAEYATAHSGKWHLANNASVLAHADDRIGQVLDTLDRLDLAENTLVIFSSDNGPARAADPTELTLMHDTATGAGYGIGASRGITGGRKGYKASLFEGGIGVPFIARWPGKIPAGKVDDASPISAVDLLPTFCEIAGAELPASYQPDGISQVAALLGNRNSGKNGALREKPLFWKINAAWPARKNQPYHWGSYAIVDRNWKLVANQDFHYLELYDIVADPYEKTDLKDDRPEIAEQLLQKLTDWESTLPAKPTGDVFSAERSQ